MKIDTNWFPGHMKAALEKLEKEKKSASAILIVLDARCPESSRNVKLESKFRGKKIIHVLNKVDLASVKITRRWISHFKRNHNTVVSLSCSTGYGKKNLFKILKKWKGEIEKKGAKKSRFSIFKLIVVGIPNTGKSSVINLLSPEKSVKTGKKPGITRGKQWLRVSPGMEILDSPGIMPPRLDLGDSVWKLGAIGAIKLEALPIENVACQLIDFLMDKRLFPVKLVRDCLPDDPAEVLTQVALRAGMLKKDGVPDRQRAASYVLKKFREGKLGRISLETPPGDGL